MSKSTYPIAKNMEYIGLPNTLYCTLVRFILCPTFTTAYTITSYEFDSSKIICNFADFIFNQGVYNFYSTFDSKHLLLVELFETIGGDDPNFSY